MSGCVPCSGDGPVHNERVWAIENKRLGEGSDA